MTFFASIRDKKGLSIYIRLRDNALRYYNFLTQEWDEEEGIDCIFLLSEYYDADVIEARYAASIPMPQSAYIVEYLYPSKRVIAEESLALSNDIDEIKNINKGNWEILNNQMIFYNIDGTELMRFDLKDRQGNLTENLIFKRERV